MTTTPTSRFTAAGGVYLRAMHLDRYFPKALVDKVQAQLVGLVAFLEAGTPSLEDLQVACDAMTAAINHLAEEFEAAGSEIETAARDDIAVTLKAVFKTYGVELDVEDALRNRDW